MYLQRHIYQVSDIVEPPNKGHVRWGQYKIHLLLPLLWREGGCKFIETIERVNIWNLEQCLL